MAYGKYETGKLMMLLKGYYGQNMAHLTMLGGYAVSTYDSTTGRETYSNYNTFSSLLNVTFGSKWKPGLLVGYTENLGSVDPIRSVNGIADA